MCLEKNLSGRLNPSGEGLGQIAEVFSGFREVEETLRIEEIVRQ
jgi:hypothetical protein